MRRTGSEMSCPKCVASPRDIAHEKTGSEVMAKFNSKDEVVCGK